MFFIFYWFGVAGLEPAITEPKSDALPLGYTPEKNTFAFLILVGE